MCQKGHGDTFDGCGTGRGPGTCGPSVAFGDRCGPAPRPDPRGPPRCAGIAIGERRGAGVRCRPPGPIRTAPGGLPGATWPTGPAPGDRGAGRRTAPRRRHCHRRSMRSWPIRTAPGERAELADGAALPSAPAGPPRWRPVIDAGRSVPAGGRPRWPSRRDLADGAGPSGTSRSWRPAPAPRSDPRGPRCGCRLDGDMRTADRGGLRGRRPASRGRGAVCATRPRGACPYPSAPTAPPAPLQPTFGFDADSPSARQAPWAPNGGPGGRRPSVAFGDRCGLAPRERRGAGRSARPPVAFGTTRPIRAMASGAVPRGLRGATWDGPPVAGIAPRPGLR